MPNYVCSLWLLCHFTRATKNLLWGGRKKMEERYYNYKSHSTTNDFFKLCVASGRNLDVTPNLKWSVVRCTTPYSNVSKKCLLCHLQGLGITIKSSYVITYMYQIFGVCDVCQQIPKSIYQASNLFPNDFSNNFS